MSIRAIGASQRLTPELILRAYALGIFPMARDRDDPVVHWVAPSMRGVLPIEGFHVPRRLARTVRRAAFRITTDTAFEPVMQSCASPEAGRSETWINDAILQGFIHLHRLGFAHSIEVWQDGDLVGGLYGVALGAAFFGESMFSTTTDASKVALVHLIARLRLGGFVLLDVQFVTDHLRQFGAVELAAPRYLDCLADAVGRAAYFPPDESPQLSAALAGVLVQSNTQMS
ncbi:MAG: leucyl/phenylalanyl-tRNA--protein transferase [Rhodospirillales bacterium]|nr:MAG: leucyl/phenylalanyl-tRNA--protein transferase [Rhodospirillales bacterium]